MAHRIGKKEDVAKALVRLLQEDLAAAGREFRGPGPREERVHGARQRLKRVRTILRVLEPEFGDRVVTLRRDLGDAARLLSRARDADVAAASARDLAATVAAGDGLGFDRIVSALDEEAARAHQERTPFGEVSRRLAAGLATATTFPDEFDGDALIAAALRETYERGRKAMRKAQGSLATPDLHRWRKAVKQLWFLTRLARRRLGKRGGAITDQLGRLGEVLGQDNDHALLAEKLALSPTGDMSLMAQLSLIARRRNGLEAEAFALGAKVYRRKPEAFIKAVKLH